MVARRHQAGPFVLNTNLRLPETADHPSRERHCGQGLVRPADEPRAAPLRQGESYVSKLSNRGSPSARRRRSGHGPAPTRTSEVRATVLNGWDVRPTLDRANANRRSLDQAAGSFVAGSPLPQALIQCRQQLTDDELRLCTLVIPVVVSTAACARRLGGGPAHDGLSTGLVRAPELTGDSPPRHIPRPTSLRAHHCVPSSVRAHPCFRGPHSPTSSGSVLALKTGSEFQIGNKRRLPSIQPSRTCPNTSIARCV